jgi:signal recognition particle subunit SRP54
MFDSMTEKERQTPTLIDDKRMARIAKGSGRKKNEVGELMQKFNMMQQVMGSIGSNPGLLGRIPGFKQLGQLQKMKGMDLSSIFGKDAKMMEQALGGGPQQMQLPQAAPGYTLPVGQSQMAKARLMGYSNTPQGKPMTDRDRDALKERRKREKANKKKNRKKK